MGKDSKIEWCDHTFNPVWGCVKCGPGCENCYAETWASRFGHDVWGNKPRRLFGEKHWNDPLRWDRRAAKDGNRAKVFCGSMCDVFEIHPDNEWNEKLNGERQKLWDLIGKTPNLIWMLLTKRPKNVLDLTPWTICPRNVWVGVSISDSSGMWRVKELSKIPANIKFLSVEPMIGMVWASRHMDWVIIGGESEQRGKARPFPVFDAVDLIQQCDRLAIPVFVKQMGTHWAKNAIVDLSRFPDIKTVYQMGDRKGEDMNYWHEVFHRREFPK